MKKIAIYILNIYQKILSPLLHQLLGVSTGCRFSVSCSEYAKTQVLKKGVIKGGYFSAVRVLKCQPLFK